MSRVVVVWMAFLVPVVQAQDPHAQAAARALFHEGLEHADAEDWAQAAESFERAQALRPAAAIALNLGIAQAHLGRLVEATESYRWVLRAEDGARFHARAQQRLEALLPRLGELVVELEGPREGVTLWVDEREVSLAMVGVASPIDPGGHHVAVQRDGQVVAESHEEIDEGGARLVRLTIPALPEPVVELQNTELPDAVPTVSDPIDVEPPRPWYRRGWIWAVVGVVIAGAVAGVALAARRGGSNNNCDDLALGCVRP